MSKHHFLYVEDDLNSRIVMEMLLQYYSEPIQITIFENSANFLERLQGLSPQPNIIFLDIHMEPYTGFEVLNMVRSNPSSQSTRVIALTASVMNEEVKRLETAGFDGAIAKPINRQAFPKLIDSILKGQEVWHIS